MSLFARERYKQNFGGREIQLRMQEEAVRVLEKLGNDLLGRAQRDAPVDEGTLRGSGTVEIEHTAHGAEAIVSFNTVYAARQHEELEWQHPKGGKAKYLEDNLKAMAPHYAEAIAAALREGA